MVPPPPSLQYILAGGVRSLSALEGGCHTLAHCYNQTMMCGAVRRVGNEVFPIALPWHGSLPEADRQTTYTQGLAPASKTGLHCVSRIGQHHSICSACGHALRSVLAEENCFNVSVGGVGYLGAGIAAVHVRSTGFSLSRGLSLSAARRPFLLFSPCITRSFSDIVEHMGPQLETLKFEEGLR